MHCSLYCQTENNKDLRFTISQERLDGLAFHAVENEAAKQLNTDDLLDSFANNKARHCKLMALTATDHVYLMCASATDQLFNYVLRL